MVRNSCQTLLVLALLLFMLPAVSSASTVIMQEYAKDEILVCFRPEAATNRLLQTMTHARTGAAVLREFDGLKGVQLLKIPKGLTVPEAILRYKNDRHILYAEPNHLIQISEVIPNDTYFHLLWNLRNTGQSGGTAGCDIRAAGAWRYSRGTGGNFIAVIDTGTDINHPDLSANLVPGRNITNNNTNVTDENGHGTHITGIIGAVGNNSLGTTGVMWKAAIMPVKALNSTGGGTIADVVSAINYAGNNGARIINISWGWLGSPNTTLHNTIRDSPALVICAAGNKTHNNDSATKFYPAGYNLPNIISVAATNRDDTIAPFSNYGANSVHIAAPGVSVYSTYPNNTYQYLEGTSAAAAHVSGVAGLLKAINPSLTNAEIKSIILDTADRLPSLSGKLVTGGRVNAQKALEKALGVKPVTIADVNLSQALRTLTNKNAGDITDWDLLQLTALNLQNLDIKSISGLEHAKFLTSLNLSSNRLTDISALKALPRLESVDLRRNRLSITCQETLSHLRELAANGVHVLWEPQETEAVVQTLTPAGNTAESLGARLVFESLNGNVQIKKRSAPACLPSEGYRYVNTFYHLSVVGSFTGNVYVTLPYSPADVTNEDNLKICHFTGSGWEDITIPNGIDKTKNTVTGLTRSFSEFCILEASSAAPPAFAAYGSNTYLLLLLAILLFLAGLHLTRKRGWVNST